MSYIFNSNSTVSFADNATIDAFGRLRVSEITSYLELKYLSDKQPLLVDEIISGSSTSAFNSNNSEINMNVFGSGDLVIRQSKYRGIYQPGKGQLFEASFSDFNIESDVIKRVGYFSSSFDIPYSSTLDGFFLESNGVDNSISFQIWKKGTQIFSGGTDSWNNNEFDITALDWSKTNLCLVDFQWLGVGRVRFGLNLSGITYFFAEHSGTGHLDNVYMVSPNQPIRYEIRSSGGAGQFNQICSQVSIEGSLNSLNKTVGLSNATEITCSTSGVTYPIIGYRLKTGSTFSNAIIDYVAVLQTTNDNYLASIQFNPTLSSQPSYPDVNNSSIQYAVGNGTITVTSAGHIISNYIGKAGSLGTDKFDYKDNSIKPGVGISGNQDTVWFCVTPLSNNSKFRTSININYFD